MYNNNCTISYENLSHELMNRNKEILINFFASDDIRGDMHYKATY